MKIVSSSIFYVNADQLQETSSWITADNVNNLLINGDAEFGSLYNFNYAGIVTGGSQRAGNYAFTSTAYTTVLSTRLIPVNVNDVYYISAWMKSIGAGGLSDSLSGFASYDKNFNFIGHECLGGKGNTTLATTLISGANFITISSATGWSITTDPSYAKYINIYRPASADYYVPYYYTREQLTYTTASGTVLTLSSTYGGNTIVAGTPISNGGASSTYNYALHSGVTSIPATWTKYSVSNITGEYGYGNPPNNFRNGTKYMVWMHLANFGQGATYSTLVDDIVMANLTNPAQSFVYNKSVSLSKYGALMTSDINELGF